MPWLLAASIAWVVLLVPLALLLGRRLRAADHAGLRTFRAKAVAQYFSNQVSTPWRAPRPRAHLDAEGERAAVVAPPTPHH